MLRFFFLLSLSNCLSSELANSQCQNFISEPIDKDNCESNNKVSKLKKELEFLSSSEEVQRVRLEAMSLRLEQQTKVLDEILSKLSTKSDSDSNVANNNCPRFPNSCDEATTVSSESGIYSIQVPSFSAQTFLVYCNTEEQGGGWTVIQRRVDDSIDFNRDWAEYKIGFGNLEGNFFIGLDKMHALTYAAPQELLITLTDFENVTKYAKYDSFAIGDESQSYALNVLGKYSGDVGDSLKGQQGMKFSTKDKDNDIINGSCAVEFKGGWWYHSCHDSNLNGLYVNNPEDVNAEFNQGIDWTAWHGIYYSLKTVSMMIRPKRN